MDNKLADEHRVVVVSGGTYGIGRGITLELASRGWAVVAFGLEQRQLGSSAEKGIGATQASLADRGLSADLLEADVTSASEVQGVVDFAVSKYGTVNALVNNAAIHPVGKILDISEEVWDRAFAVNIKGQFLCTRAVLPHLIRNGGGAIVNIGSGSGWGNSNLSAYCSSKSAIFGFSQSTATDYKAQHVRVNMVIPGGSVTTGMNEESPDRADRASRAAAASVAGRNVEPADVAQAVAFLLSEEAAQITGAFLNVGGFVMQGHLG